MALFTDPAVVTLDDLLEFEASLAGVASSYGIDVDNKISLATSAISDKLMLWLLNSGAADPQWLNRRMLGLSTVVVTPSLQRWICFESLSRVFAEAYNVQLNTRFQGKLDGVSAGIKERLRPLLSVGRSDRLQPAAETGDASVFRADREFASAIDLHPNGVGRCNRERKRLKYCQWVRASRQFEFCGGDGRRSTRGAIHGGRLERLCRQQSGESDEAK